MKVILEKKTTYSIDHYCQQENEHVFVVQVIKDLVVIFYRIDNR
jgi:hypothetical protein